MPHSLLVTRVGLLPGLGRSWSVQVYVINGHPTVPGIAKNEEEPPLVNASPHPYELPCYTLMQHARIDEMEEQRLQNEALWNVDQPAAEEIQENG